MVELLELINQARPNADDIRLNLSTRRSPLASAIAESLPELAEELGLSARFVGARVTMHIVRRELAQFKRERVDWPEVELERYLKEHMGQLEELVELLEEPGPSQVDICAADLKKMTNLLDDYKKWSNDLRAIERRWRFRHQAIEDLLEETEVPLEALEPLPKLLVPFATMISDLRMGRTKTLLDFHAGTSLERTA